MSGSGTVDTNFVVYAYVRKGADKFGRNNTFYYIGKGRPDRPYRGKGRRNAKTPKDKNRILILHSGLTEELAFEYEKKLIKFYGRADLHPSWGILRNLTNGGEGLSGYVMTDEQKKKLSNAGKKLIGGKNPNYGNKYSEEHRARLSLMAKERFKVKENNPMYGKTHTPEVRKILSDKAKLVVGRDHPRTKLYDWHHKDHGDILSVSILELIDLFPDQKLKYTSLCDVVKGRCAYSKGWGLLKNKDKDNTHKFTSIKKLCSWKHETYGLHENISAPDLIKKFPYLGLVRSCLNALSLGKLKRYKGWTLVDGNCNNHTPVPKKSDWYHPDYGIQKDMTINELVETFQEQKLSPSKLSIVRNGKINSHKGWTNPK